MRGLFCLFILTLHLRCILVTDREPEIRTCLNCQSFTSNVDMNVHCHVEAHGPNDQPIRMGCHTFCHTSDGIVSHCFLFYQMSDDANFL